MDFSIRKSGKIGEIEFSVIHNDKEILKEVVTQKNSATIRFSVDKGDTIEVIADKHGSTGYDHENLQITSMAKGD